MKRIVLDANILLSFLTDRDPHQQEAATLLLEGAAQGRHVLILHQLVVVELVYVLLTFYRLKTSVISTTVGNIFALPGMVLEDEVAWPSLLDLWPARFTDFTDAALAAVTMQRGYDAIATFDQRFARQLTRNGLKPHLR